MDINHTFLKTTWSTLLYKTVVKDSINNAASSYERLEKTNKKKTPHKHSQILKVQYITSCINRLLRVLYSSIHL